MPVDERILLAIEAVYDAALDECQWTRALDALTAATGVDLIVSISEGFPRARA